MRPIAERHGVSVAQIALAWLLAKSHVSSVIIGARTIEQLRDNLSASKLKLAPEDVDALDEISQLSPEYPGWMIAWQGRYRANEPVKD
jgi:aryl-alcohol dehydrogenase-like predicted oxidoreductase